MEAEDAAAVRAARRRAERDRAARRSRAAGRSGRSGAAGAVDRRPCRSRAARRRGARHRVEEPEPELSARVQAPGEDLHWVANYFPRAYRHWGRIFFSPLTVDVPDPAVDGGLASFTYIVGARYGTPFVVANRLRDRRRGVRRRAGSLIVAFHELAHGLALAHYGRRDRAPGCGCSSYSRTRSSIPARRTSSRGRTGS